MPPFLSNQGVRITSERLIRVFWWFCSTHSLPSVCVLVILQNTLFALEHTLYPQCVFWWFCSTHSLPSVCVLVVLQYTLFTLGVCSGDSAEHTLCPRCVFWWFCRTHSLPSWFCSTHSLPSVCVLVVLQYTLFTLGVWSSGSAEHTLYPRCVFWWFCSTHSLPSVCVLVVLQNTLFTLGVCSGGSAWFCRTHSLPSVCVLVILQNTLFALGVCSGGSAEHTLYPRPSGARLITSQNPSLCEAFYKQEKKRSDFLQGLGLQRAGGPEPLKGLQRAGPGSEENERVCFPAWFLDVSWRSVLSLSSLNIQESCRSEAETLERVRVRPGAGQKIRRRCSLTPADPQRSGGEIRRRCSLTPADPQRSGGEIRRRCSLTPADPQRSGGEIGRRCSLTPADPQRSGG
ncbi:hypothetical protein JOQ06_028016, partial [Pogonophryne albipinna]